MAWYIGVSNIKWSLFGRYSENIPNKIARIPVSNSAEPNHSSGIQHAKCNWGYLLIIAVFLEMQLFLCLKEAGY